MSRRITNDLFVVALLSFLWLPIPLLAQSNAGFVQGLWYDRETLLAEVPTRIYAAIRNNTGADLTGTVEFYVNEKQIERSNVAALNNRIIESWADWRPRYGTSTIRAVISRTEITSTASGTSAVQVVSAVTEDVVFVDYDTDGDGIPNRRDTDDDNDGISDTKEREDGTDPLDPNSPAPAPENNEAGAQEKNQTSETSNEQVDDPTEEGTEPKGLERYLTNSPANATFGRITDAVNSTRSRLDTYRETRNAEIRDKQSIMPEPAAENPSLETNATTSSSTATSKNEPGRGIQDNEIERIQALAPQDTDSWLAAIWKFVSRNVQNAYTFILFMISSLLAHPALVQLLLLLLILYGTYRLARKYGRRKNV